MEPPDPTPPGDAIAVTATDGHSSKRVRIRAREEDPIPPLNIGPTPRRSYSSAVAGQSPDPILPQAGPTGLPRTILEAHPPATQSSHPAARLLPRPTRILVHAPPAIWALLGRPTVSRSPLHRPDPGDPGPRAPHRCLHSLP
ncbi:hypothetical protein K2173_019351 [Erythroxylum novogranatense]|uniref:Uncharacterized protein n=1 Tax=Erythroxylum novogranatense TaxID=1862640 RepID=A0AAV8UAY7_9ROSI|nr:hypothetical protein K2173_019351 [Erythroxylum novogranatense]